MQISIPSFRLTLDFQFVALEKSVVSAIKFLSSIFSKDLGGEILIKFTFLSMQLFSLSITNSKASLMLWPSPLPMQKYLPFNLD